MYVRHLSHYSLIQSHTTIYKVYIHRSIPTVFIESRKISFEHIQKQISIVINLSCSSAVAIHPLFYCLPAATLCLVRRGRDVTATTGPVDVVVLALGVLLVREFRLDQERVSAEVVTLGLEQVGGQVLGAVTVEPRQRRRESGRRDTEKGGLGHDVSPAGLRLVDSLVEEVIEKQVLEFWVVTVSSCDILQEHRADNAASSPHESNRGLVELPPVVLRSLYTPVG